MRIDHSSPESLAMSLPAGRQGRGFTILRTSRHKGNPLRDMEERE
jgi:hypothetical protein